MTPCIVLTAVGAGFEATALAAMLVERRLAACVNIVPAVTSVYRWKDAIEVDGEQLLVIKTVREHLDALREALFAVHPYEVPELVVVPIDEISAAYGQWLVASVS